MPAVKKLVFETPSKSNLIGRLDVTKSPKTHLTLKTKGEIIEQSKLVGFSPKRAADKYGVSKSCISKILKNQASTLQSLNENRKSIVKTVHKSRFPEIETKLYEWFNLKNKHY